MFAVTFWLGVPLKNINHFKHIPMTRLFFFVFLSLTAFLLYSCDPEDLITFNVDTNADHQDTNPGDDICQGPRGCSLRAALQEAAAGTKKDITINLPSGTYLLDLDRDELVVEGKLIKIRGGGMENTVIDARESSRVMSINSGIVSVTDVTLQNGETNSFNGGGVYIDSTALVTMDRVAIRNCKSLFQGGGLYIRNGANVVLRKVLIADNETGKGGGGGGGGIMNRGNLTIENSTIRGNVGGWSGGGISHASGRLTLKSSTVSNNQGPISGLNLFASATLSNVTVSGNQQLTDRSTYSGRAGVGVSIAKTTSMRNVTVTDNGNTLSNSSGNRDGGVRVVSGGTLYLQNSLIAENRQYDCLGSVTSRGNNLIGDASSATVSTASGDQLGTASSPIDPTLGTLTNNGGTTQTHALLAGSPAIDAGSNLAPASDPAACLPEDQRGVERPKDGDGRLPNVCDIGAFELEP